jgi:hypothetical protein
VSIGVDRANVGPIASQVAGFCGAFLGAVIAQKRKRSVAEPLKSELAKTNNDPGAPP